MKAGTDRDDSRSGDTLDAQRDMSSRTRAEDIFRSQGHTQRISNEQEQENGQEQK